MEINKNFETYILLDKKKIIISVYSNSNKKILEKIMFIEDYKKKIDFEILDFFLRENIHLIEKKIETFIKNINVIIDLEEFYSFDISIKNDYERTFDKHNINYLLHEAKDYCSKTLNKKKLVHLTIKNYLVNNKNYSNFPDVKNCKSFSLDINFLCISDTLVRNLEDVLKKYQITLNKILSGKYIKAFLPLEVEKDIFLSAKKIILGYNPNEVMLVNKKAKNKGFFEKFFDFFR